MSKGKDSYTEEDVLHAIDGSEGIVSDVARVLVCEWHTAQRYIEKWESTREAFKGEEEMLLDTAEKKLGSKVKRGTSWALKFYLSTKGKRRGYTKREEITGADGEPIRAILHTITKFTSPDEWEKVVHAREDGD